MVWLLPALVAYNLLAVVLAAWRGVHGEETVDEEVSLYFMTVSEV